MCDNKLEVKYFLIDLNVKEIITPGHAQCVNGFFNITALTLVHGIAIWIVDGNVINSWGQGSKIKPETAV